MAAKPKEYWRERLNVPMYRVGEAAIYAKVAPQTVASWHKRDNDFRPLLSKRERREGLTYLQLIETAVVATLRQTGMKLKDIARAHAYLISRSGYQFPFAQAKFKTDGVDILLEDFSEDGLVSKDKMIAANHGGQLVWSEAIYARFREFEYGKEGLVDRWQVTGETGHVIIDPRVAYGAPHVRGIPTWVLRDRWKMGEGLGDISDDFDLPKPLVEEALSFENVIIDRKRPNQWVN